MWDEVRIFGDEGMIELRRPLEYPIGWTMDSANTARQIPGATPLRIRHPVARRRGIS